MKNLVVDTDVVSFGFRQDSRFVESYGPAIQGSDCLISFVTVAELHFWAENRTWGPAKKSQLDAYLDRYYFLYGVSTELCRAWRGFGTTRDPAAGS